ncbi:MAG TPA: LysR family transcriptional regulator [Acidimicrobiales bacterium]|nr:LysR family transcriptional regulator [Acidimicrobiales bacterium]
MNLRYVEYFLATIEHHGMRRAALALHVPQPSLSHGLRSLERELGVTLFRRVGQQMLVSPEGRAFVRPARQLLRDSAIACSAVASAVGVAGGRLDLVTEPAVAADPTASLIGAFRRQNPQVRVNLSTAVPEVPLTRSVSDGRCEVGIGYLPQPPTSLEQYKIGEHEVVLLMPPGSPDPGETVALESLTDQPMIVVPRGSAQRDFFDKLLAEAGVRTRIAVQVAHREAILPMVLAGAGSTLIPRPRVEAAVERGAMVRSLSPPVRRPIGLFHRRGHLSPVATRFKALAVDGDGSSSPPKGEAP